VVSLNINNEEQLLRALADTEPAAVSFLKVILQRILSKEIKVTWSTMGGQFITSKTGLVTFLLPEFNLKKQIS
jgi:hypothetical protein